MAPFLTDFYVDCEITGAVYILYLLNEVPLDFTAVSKLCQRQNKIGVCLWMWYRVL